MDGLKMIKKTLVTGLLLIAFGQANAVSFFQDYYPEVVVSDPYIELRTGPGRGYPIFYVAGQGDAITLLKSKTEWYKVRVSLPREKEGWVHRSELQHTLDLDGNEVDFGSLGLGDFANRRFEFGFNGGDFGGASSLTGYIGYALTPNITFQIEGTQILGDFSDGVMGSANIVMYPFPKWRLSPYFTIGSGIIRTKPHTTIVQAEDREDEIAHAGIGANLYLSDRFMLRMEYKRHTVLTSRDDNEEVDQWKAGFSVFF
ncbi:MAG: SH3 domain-containing protein [Pseudomonadales bacterium]|nr:SH3 domain-containing protein [Pseudomonadales bacterium]